ncbi:MULTISPECIES: ankyrin repeat domain-containing protein [unclassified Modicisalibacter]|uniref:ankyrin repeat domain-containing protein n=1 Tax=unclassified Modicisalibacter TaxID=2679913 RepID=UPI001CC97250|nr:MULTISPECIES: ankyrin repeat domain-containing protein [unclassified Modicisalibacter]MBZ9559206.1 ankyrin repeat domain-containing protein [Modicisalibacter sp. R2A 31.J]MBZ9576629.1 ankyrin repeat domain-containing protein [Modicisalibacter sp. MOD 31.J]
MRLTMWLCAALLSMLTLPACAGYSKQPSYYFKDEAQLALVQAVGDGDVQAVQRALDHGADPNAVGKRGMTPLFWAVTMQPDIEIFRYLLDNGGDPNLTTIDKKSSGIKKVGLLYQAYRNPDPTFIEAVLEAGGDPNYLYNGAQTLLYHHMSDERIEHIKALVNHGAEVDFKVRFDETPLFNAVMGQEYETALVLLNAGADPNMIESGGGYSIFDILKEFKDREAGGDYKRFVDALKQRGYLDPSF